ncbi:MAG: hormogonium polysaccharide biosynthesis protein HpsL [Cyanobacteria bacterium P01_G01_bin.54]
MAKKRQKSSSATALSPKEQALLKRQAKEAQKKRLNVASVCIALGLVLGLPLVAVDPKLGLAIGAGLPVMYWSFQYPRTALWMFLAYMPFSGTVLYQIVGGNAIFNLAKDGFFIPAFIALFLECRRRKQKQPVWVSDKLVVTLGLLAVSAGLTLLVVNGAMQFVLPLCQNLPNGGQGMMCKDGIPLAQGVLGLKVLLGYVPLIFCGYHFIRNQRQLLWLGRFHLLLAIACCGLGILQYLMLERGSCIGTQNEVGDALFKASIEAKCLVGGALGYSPSQNFIRLPGTFASPWHWSWFLISNSAITFTTAFCDTALWWRLGGLMGMAMVFVNAVISGQRIALALVPVVTVILLVLTGQLGNLKRFIPIGLGLLVLLGGVMATNPELVQERIDSFTSRVEASPPQEFIVTQFKWAMNEQRGFLGRGLGKATNSTRIFGQTALVETFHPKLLYEMGYPGMIAFVAFTTHITWVTFWTTRSLKTVSIRNIGGSLWVFILIISFFPYWYPLDTDPVAVYYWLFVGVILKMPVLDRNEQAKRQELLAQQESELLDSGGKKRRGKKRVRLRGKLA